MIIVSKFGYNNTVVHDRTQQYYLDPIFKSTNQKIKRANARCQHLQMLHPFQIVEQNFTGNAYYKMKNFEAL